MPRARTIDQFPSKYFALAEAILAQIGPNTPVLLDLTGNRTTGPLDDPMRAAHALRSEFASFRRALRHSPNPMHQALGKRLAMVKFCITPGIPAVQFMSREHTPFDDAIENFLATSAPLPSAPAECLSAPDPNAPMGDAHLAAPNAPADPHLRGGVQRHRDPLEPDYAALLQTGQRRRDPDTDPSGPV